MPKSPLAVSDGLRTTTPPAASSALDLHAVVARISDRQPLGIERQLGLFDVDIAGEHRAVGAVLDLDAVGGDVDRRVAVMALERRHRALLLLRQRRRARDAPPRSEDARMMPNVRMAII